MTGPSLFEALADALPGLPRGLAVTGRGSLPSAFRTTDLAAASMGAAGLALSLWAAGAGAPAPVTVDRRLASMWFGWTLRPRGWDVLSPWDPLTGDYEARDGWIRIHANAPRHRAAALRVLETGAERAGVAAAIARWPAEDLEEDVVREGGCAAAMRTVEAWSAHPQGRAVADGPLVRVRPRPAEKDRPGRADPARPLAGIRVLDLTRVLAGPVAGRFLAAFGASVLRVDPPWWDEPGVAPEVTLGKRCCGLDLREADGRAAFGRLLGECDVLLHGYRPGALAGLGWDEDARRAVNPDTVDVGLDAYGWTGPWADRRGFDSLVQMSSGVAAAGMAREGAAGPSPLPAQALDHATGYMMAASALLGLARRARDGETLSARHSLARTARLLTAFPETGRPAGHAPETEGDLADGVEHTAWGPARRVRFPVAVEGCEARWDLAAGPLRASPPEWP